MFTNFKPLWERAILPYRCHNFLFKDVTYTRIFHLCWNLYFPKQQNDNYVILFKGAFFIVKLDYFQIFEFDKSYCNLDFIIYQYNGYL